ncbi:TIGR02647 family protein [Sulfuriferula nivalis]|uniref:DNA-binding protein n=1 Tax=Sulfuriferula nivalis TaxID=2675298 RepID=A0A809RH89_9PROT|nr:TIGR02647 family protein [Sulfuriferula nivalis]BBP00996.1 DNA-binding protein [Sulfuriferula nivalis]
MIYTKDLVDELNALLRYDLTTNQQGIKIHKNADAAVIATTARLFDKGLVTEVDGGYLTDLGREVAEHAAMALTILTSVVAV